MDGKVPNKENIVKLLRGTDEIGYVGCVVLWLRRTIPLSASLILAGCPRALF